MSFQTLACRSWVELCAVADHGRPWRTILSRVVGQRRAVGAGAAAAAAAAQGEARTDRAAAGARSGGARRDRVRAQDRDQLEGAAPGARVWLRGHLLAAAARVAAGPGVAAAASRRARPARPAGPAGLVASGGRQRERAGQASLEATGPSPTDRGKAGSKYHVLCDRNGLPLHALITGANTHDRRMLAPLLDTNPGVRERQGDQDVPRRPAKLHADKGYDYPRCRRYLAHRGIGCASLGVGSRTPPGSGVPLVVERTMSWLLNFRRLALRYDRTESTITALLSLACALICHRRLAQHPPPSSAQRELAVRRSGPGQRAPGQPFQALVSLVEVEAVQVERPAHPLRRSSCSVRRGRPARPGTPHSPTGRPHPPADTPPARTHTVDSAPPAPARAIFSTLI